MRINHAIKTLIISDFFINAGFSVFAPVFAIFITKQITGATVETVGFAAAIAQIFKSVLQIPIARYLDRNHGEYDDFYSMIFGSLLIASVPFAYIFAKTVAHVYLIQAMHGIGLAFLVPPWYAIFSRHLDKLKENVEWSTESVTIGIASATAAAVGGIFARKFGFNFVFYLGGILALFGTYIQAKIYQDLKGRVGHGQVNPHKG